MATTLVTPAWLALELEQGNKNLRIFDTSIQYHFYGDEEFKRCHIPGAQMLNLFKHMRSTVEIPIGLPDLAVYQEFLRSLGINSTSHVILYENTPLHPYNGPRFWWMLRAFGVKNVSILDGGLPVWQKENRPTTDQITQYEKGDVTLSVDKGLLMSYEEYLASCGVEIVDTRPPENFTGQEDEPSQFVKAFLPFLNMKTEDLHRLQTGHRPGAINVPYPTLYKEDGVTFKSKDELMSLFNERGVKLTGPVTASCYVGLTACIFLVGASVCGHNDFKLYPGSWIEYGQRAPADRVTKN